MNRSKRRRPASRGRRRGSALPAAAAKAKRKTAARRRSRQGASVAASAGVGSGSRAVQGRPAAAQRRSYGAYAALTAQLRHEGVKLGEQWRAEHPEGTAEELKRYVQEQWNGRSFVRNKDGVLVADAGYLWRCGDAFGEGAMDGAGVPDRFAPLPLKGSAAAVLYAGASSESVLAVLRELEQLPLDEVIIVTDDRSESWLWALRSRTQATIACWPGILDADVGRALGAKLTGADIVLFADGGAPVPAESLAPFLLACDGRLDVALNDLSDSRLTFDKRSGLLHCQEFLNATLNRPDLRMNSLAFLPHALSRHALTTIGPADLAVPAKAHASAILKGLEVGTAGRAGGAPRQAAESERMPLAAGDLFEAWRKASAVRGPRLTFRDLSRNRRAAGGLADDESIDHHTDE